MYINAYFLVEMRSVFVTSSIYITVAMAKQRFDALKNPIAYHNAQQVNEEYLRRRAILWILMLEFAAFVVSIPLFLEPTVVEVPFIIRNDINETHMILVRF